MIPNNIGGFDRYIGNPTSMKYGYYYQKEVTLPFSKEKKRMIRVWLPEDYDFNNPHNRYPVIYMSDGQNLVDRYLSAFGEWELDKTIHNLINEGYKGVIAVGIDCPKEPIERTKELCPPYEVRKEIYEREGYFKSYANEYIDYIVNTLKPLIDNTFYTLKDKRYTGIGGSSMGGLMSFYAYIYQRDIFGYSLSFSPAFFFYEKEKWESILDSYKLDSNINGKLFLYVGGKDFEAIFVDAVKSTYDYLINHSFNDKNASLIIDENEVHHEKAWAKYLGEALKYWLKDI